MFIFSIICLLVIGVFVRPLFYLLMSLNWIGNLLFLLLAMFSGWCMCSLNGHDYGMLKLLLMGCLFMALSAWLNVIGAAIAIIIGIFVF